MNRSMIAAATSNQRSDSGGSRGIQMNDGLVARGIG
jgi:hypothetical protein